MRSDDLSSGIDRRALVSNLVLLPALSTALLSLPAQGQTTVNAPLASWNEGPAKQAIVDFVRATTQQGGPGFVPPEDRIAAFDQDGTLWVEHPIYNQVVYCLDRVPAVVAQKPELSNVEPFKTVLSGDREAIAKFAWTFGSSGLRPAAFRRACSSLSISAFSNIARVFNV